MKIHFISNSLKTNSGFSIATRYIANGLQALGHEVSMSSLQTSYVPEYHYNIQQLPVLTVLDNETAQIQKNIIQTNPDVVIYIGDMYVESRYVMDIIYLIKNMKKKLIVGCPVEGGNIPAHMINNLKTIINNGGKIISECHYGEREMLKEGIPNTCIYFGFDPEIYRPIDIGKGKESYEKTKASNYCYYQTDVGKIMSDPRKIYERHCNNCTNADAVTSTSTINNCPYFEQEIIIYTAYADKQNQTNSQPQWTEFIMPISKLQEQFKNKFTYLFVGANYGYIKRIERLLSSYSNLIQESNMLKDRTQLHLHCYPQVMNGLNLLDLIEKLYPNIRENVSFTYGNILPSGFSNTAMNLLFNMADVQVSASSAEGFGISSLFGFATGLPLVAPADTSFIELIGNNPDKTKNRGLLVNIQSDVMVPDTSIRFLVDTKDMASKMKEIYANKSLRDTLSKNVIEWSKQYKWENIVKEWDSLLKTWKVT